MRYSLLLPVVAGLVFVGCGGSGSSGGGSASTAPGSTAGPGTGVTAVGPLHKKALDLQVDMQREHLPLGQVQNVKVSGGQVQKQGNAPSRVLWTGFYAASQAMRYRSTQDPDALAAMESALWTLHDLHEVTGISGVIARGYDEAHIETHGFPASGRFTGYNYNKGTPSRDQYTGWFYGIAHGFPHVQDPALRQALQADVSAVCDRLMAGDLEMSAPWGPAGTVEVFFNLNPDYFYQNKINAQTWATVDDFPFNLITKSVPYSPQLANAIASANIPPVRAGEALRAVFFFTVAADVTGDPRYAAYKDQLLHQRGFADAMEKYITILDDILHGQNLQVAEDTIKQLFMAIGDILAAYLTATGQSAIITQVILPAIFPTIAGWIANFAVDVVQWLHDPNNAAKLQTWVGHAQTLTALLSLIGQQNLANQINSVLNTYLANLSHQGLIDFSNTVRSHLGTNLTLMPLAKLIDMESDPQMVARYKAMLDRYHHYIKDDHNPVVNLVHHGYGAQPNANDLPHSIEALTRFPVDRSMREVDNSNWPGLVVSPWPDRFGKTGNHALVPHYFPVDHRAPNIFIWRSHPRQIKSGANAPDLKVAPLSYILPYWMARDLQVIGPAD